MVSNDTMQCDIGLSTACSLPVSRWTDLRYDIRLLKLLSECRAHTIKLQVKNN